MAGAALAGRHARVPGERSGPNPAEGLQEICQMPYFISNIWVIFVLFCSYHYSEIIFTTLWVLPAFIIFL